VNKSTSISGTGDDTWTVTFSPGTYKFVCDPHASQMKGSFTVTAAPVQLAVAKQGDGSGSVTSDPGGIDCGSTCSATFAKNASVTLTATPATGSTFSGWGGDCSGTSTCSLTMSDDRSVTATFALQRLGVTVVKSGNGHGTVTSAPAGIDCGATCSGTFAYGTSVTLTPAPADDSTFTGWDGACAGTAACTVTVDAAKSVTAGFALKRFAVHVARKGAGRVTSAPGGIACGGACAADFDYGMVVRLTAAPGPGSTFAGWTGACTGAACALTVTADRAVTATFAPVAVKVTKSAVVISLRLAGRTRGRIELLHAGKRVLSRSVSLASGRLTVPLPTKPGTYVLRLTIAGKRVLVHTVRVGG
jgi:List-Bact-rpt repeat protein/copper binding plastocyanin/azurin family protein